MPGPYGYRLPFTISEMVSHNVILSMGAPQAKLVLIGSFSLLHMIEYGMGKKKMKKTGE